MADQQPQQNNNINQQQPPQQGYYVVNMSTAPYASYPTTLNTQVPVFPNPVQQPYYVQPGTQPQPQYPYSAPTPTASYYVPQQNGQYYYDTSANTIPMGYSNVGIPNETSAPLLVMMSVKDRLYMREYEVKCTQWLEESWELFKSHWLALVVFTIVSIAVQFVPYVGSILTFMLQLGFFIAASHYARTKTWCGVHLFHGIYLFFPLFVIAFLYGLLISIGLFLCIIPGLYFLIAYGFSMYVYIEFRQEGLGMIEAMSVSRHVLSKNFWSITGFFLFTILITLLGALALGVGLLVSIPVASMMSAFAFRDIFGFSEKRVPEKGLICC